MAQCPWDLGCGMHRGLNHDSIIIWTVGVRQQSAIWVVILTCTCSKTTFTRPELLGRDSVPATTRQAEIATPTTRDLDRWAQHVQREEQPRPVSRPSGRGVTLLVYLAATKLPAQVRPSPMKSRCSSPLPSHQVINPHSKNHRHSDSYSRNLKSYAVNQCR